jgi:hypothetical protein
MVLADQDSWDRYAAASWFNIRRWLDASLRIDEPLSTSTRLVVRGARRSGGRYERNCGGSGI